MMTPACCESNVTISSCPLMKIEANVYPGVEAYGKKLHIARLSCILTGMEG